MGEFDGGGFVIRGLVINRGSANNIGLFGFVRMATLKNIGMASVGVSANDSVGALVGIAEYTTITDVEVAGSVWGNNTVVGGVVGGLSRGSSMQRSRSSGNVCANWAQGGGLVGRVSDSVVEYSYSTADVSVPNAGVGGGAIGVLTGLSTVQNSFSKGRSVGNPSVGGLVGTAESPARIVTSYAASVVTSSGISGIGGVVGSSGVGPVATYWDTQVSGRSTVAGNSSATNGGLTTAQAKNKTSYVGWDFTSVWGIDPAINDGYPYLRVTVNGACCVAPGDGSTPIAVWEN